MSIAKLTDNVLAVSGSSLRAKARQHVEWLVRSMNTDKMTISVAVRLMTMSQKERDHLKYVKNREKIRRRVRSYQQSTGYAARYWASKDERNAYVRAMYAARKQRASA